LLNAKYYAESPPVDPPGPAAGDAAPAGGFHVLRGGSWLQGAAWCRCAVRDPPNLHHTGCCAHYGFRAVVVAQLGKETTAGTFDGIILNKGPDFVEFKADGEDVPRRYSPPALPGGGLDVQVLDSIKKVVTLNRAKLSWKLQPDGQPAVVGIQVEVPPPSGTLVGAVAYLQNNCLEVKPDNGPPERFLPRWAAGGPDAAVVQALAKLKVGDKVKVTWTYDNRKRLTAIEAAP